MAFFNYIHIQESNVWQPTCKTVCLILTPKVMGNKYTLKFPITIIIYDTSSRNTNAYKRSKGLFMILSSRTIEKKIQWITKKDIPPVFQKHFSHIWYISGTTWATKNRYPSFYILFWRAFSWKRNFSNHKISWYLQKRIFPWKKCQKYD